MSRLGIRNSGDLGLSVRTLILCICMVLVGAVVGWYGMEAVRAVDGIGSVHLFGK